MCAAPRLEGARNAAAARGGEQASFPGARIEPLPLAYTERSEDELIGSRRPLDLNGVFAYSDEYALLLRRALQHAGVDVPGETAVVGADRPAHRQVAAAAPDERTDRTAPPGDDRARGPSHPRTADAARGVHDRSSARIEPRESSGSGQGRQ
ncbi:substrate-binding domain-containing protein [Streptomyces bobili]|uniref:substrate-binding domain-containing protein n=1 Tax=Streptomyces bobili TaxID=67280 RepID=UPI0036EE54A2